MDVGAQERAIEHGDHVVHFYEQESELVETVSAYLVEALGAAGEGALARVCREHSAVLERTPVAVGDRDVRAGGPAHADVSATFPAEPSSPGRARRLAAATLRSWGHGERLVEDVSLVVSELASNAVRHAGSEFSLSLTVRGELLRVTVEDSAPLPGSRLTPRPPHGLCVIDSLSAEWGVEPTRAGKLVWAQLASAAPLRR